MRPTSKSLSVYFFLVVLVCGRSVAFNFLPYILGFGGVNRAPKVATFEPVEYLVSENGFALETHEVISQDGYIIVLHRIRSKNKPAGPATIIQHGFLGASDNFLLRGADRDLPFVLADAGYDVWMSNFRGNAYSRRHKTLDPDKNAEYWNYSLHEPAYYDLAATIDYIIEATGQKRVFFVGYSIGSTIGFMLCALRPEYNDKIRLHVALAPLTYTSTDHYVQKILLTVLAVATQFLLSHQIYELLPRNQRLGKLVGYLCQDNVPTQRLCLLMMFLVVGADYSQFNSTLFSTAAHYYPAGTSVRLAQHVQQFYTTGEFGPIKAQYDTLNGIHWNGSEIPTNYDLSKATAPVSLHYGTGDFLVTERDIDILESKLPNVIGKFKVPYQYFNHLDFMWASDSRTLLYEQMLILMSKYR